MNNNFDEDEIQKNLERFMDQQIAEYKYVQASKLKQSNNSEASANNDMKVNTLELNVPNLSAPRRKSLSNISVIETSSTSYRSRRYEDDFDDSDYEIDSDDSFDEYDDSDSEYYSDSYDDTVENSDEEYYDSEEVDAEEFISPRRTAKNNNTSRKTRNPKKKRKGLKIVLCILIPLIAIIVAAVVGWYVLVGSAYDHMTYKPIASLKGSSLEADGNINILLLGTDTRNEADTGRSDVCMLMTINKSQNRIYLTSFLRDTWVTIPGYEDETNRLNIAYSVGGPELTLETLSENFGVNANRYMQVNFQAFANLTDAVGGIDLEVTAEEVEWINAYLWEYNALVQRDALTDNIEYGTEGRIHLNGPQALAYCRNRYIGSDFARTDRQKKVISAIIKKLPTAAITNLGGVISGLFPNLTTNLTKDDTYKLSLMLLELSKMEIVQNSVPLEGTWEFATMRGMEVILADYDENKAYLKNVVQAKEAPATKASSSASSTS